LALRRGHQPCIEPFAREAQIAAVIDAGGLQAPIPHRGVEAPLARLGVLRGFGEREPGLQAVVPNIDRYSRKSTEDQRGIGNGPLIAGIVAIR